MKVSEILEEKWARSHKVSAAEKGKYEGKTIAELQKMRKTAKGDEIHEIDFAIRAKRAGGKKWKGVTAESALTEKKAPSAGMTKKEKSAVAKKARLGGDIGKKGKHFKEVEKSGEKQYGSKEAGERVAAAAMWKAAAKK